MTKTKVLISGASVAGPALAYFLQRDGYDVTVVERAPAVRDSGYAVDFQGAAFDVLDEMGVLGEVRGLDTKMRGVVLVDGAGAETGRLPAEVFAGELEVPKRELTRILHRITADHVEYVFGDSISTLTPHESGFAVEFECGAPREFDLVIGADGLYSKVRQLTFGPHADTVRHLGMSGAGFSAPNHLGLDRSGLLQLAEGAAVYLFSAGDPDRLTVSLSFGHHVGGAGSTRPQRSGTSGTKRVRPARLGSAAAAGRDDGGRRLLLLLGRTGRHRPLVARPRRAGRRRGVLRRAHQRHGHVAGADRGTGAGPAARRGRW
jgi:2-polyprenyl-6-methoxyphenol hydroxylase-like FAD-dependent oxidoreductase